MRPIMAATRISILGRVTHLPSGWYESLSKSLPGSDQKGLPLHPLALALLLHSTPLHPPLPILSDPLAVLLDVANDGRRLLSVPRPS